MRVLIVGDEPNIRSTLRSTLETSGHAVEEAASGSVALERVRRSAYDVALLDVWLGGESGGELFEALRDACPRLAVVVITAPDGIGTTVEATRRGAIDSIPQPLSPGQVRASLDRVARFRQLCDRVAALEDRVRAELPEADLEGRDPLVRRVMEQARRVAPSDVVVLIRGESGTGKGVLARAIHAWSKRAGGPFVTVTCSTRSPGVLESDLFGHTQGAFTDAFRDTAGKVLMAEGGTLFLDEVGGLPPTLQPKLLRLLEEHQYERVGEANPRTADVRVLAATNRDLEAAVAAGEFRRDLLYRLNVIELTLPPLRVRSDTGILADRLLAFFTRQSGRPLSGFTAEARDALAGYSWPGNHRELRNAVERAAILARGPEVGLADLPAPIAPAKAFDGDPVEVGRHVSLERIEAEHIRRVLANSASLEEAARILRIDPSTLYRRRKRIGL